jgi:hypothetical protein
VGFDVKIDERLRIFIEQQTSRKCGLVEAPKDAKRPFYNLIPIPGAELYGDLQDPNSIEEKIYQIDIVGTSPGQTEEAENRLCRRLSTSLVDSIPGVMGPPILRKNGSQRVTDQVYHRIVIARISVTEEEE